MQAKKSGEFIIRQMKRKDLDIAVEWAAREGWNPGLHDSDSFYYTDPAGFFIGEIDGEPVGTISAVAYNDEFGFIGFFMVKPEYRGKRYGIYLAKAALDYLGDRNIGLDGVVAKVKNYKHYGLKVAYHNIRYEGIGCGDPIDRVISLDKIRFEDLVSYDTRMFSAPRPQFLKRWIKQPDGKAVGVMSDGEILGYGVIRKCRIGYKIGPIFADNPEVAEMIFNSLSSGFPGQPVFLDTPGANPEAVELANRHKMKKVFETVRMYSKDTNILPVKNIFGVTSFELG
ncbi:MAG: GNAT family N-acetyltransferase [Candidatus Eremiobacteraeota bacterium]|nr:GNAT family N-acetyltransferase [Candidatus Eremiobacteraeota bacterium]